MNNIKNIIQTSVEIITITKLKKNDVVKIIEENYSDAKLMYGIVQDLLANGEDVTLQLLIMDIAYGDLKLSTKVITAKNTFQMYPANIEEVRDFFNKTKEVFIQKISEKEQELEKMKSNFVTAKKLMSLTGKLGITTPEFILGTTNDN